MAVGDCGGHEGEAAYEGEASWAGDVWTGWAGLSCPGVEFAPGWAARVGPVEEGEGKEEDDEEEED